MSRHVYGKSTTAKTRHEIADTSSMLYWLTLFFVVFFLFFSSFQTALFNGESNQVYAVNSFERPIITAVLWCSIILLLAAVFFIKHWSLNNHADLLSVLVWFIPLAYVLASFNAASSHLSTKMILLQVMYATFFVLGVYLTKNNLSNTIIINSIMICGYAVVLYGILNLLGNAYSRDGVMLTDQGLRLTSVFQYANAYAAFLMALLFAGIYLLIHSRTWYSIILHSVMLVPILLSFFLTLSRGGLVVLPIILVLVLPFLPLKKQLLFILYLIISTLASLTITDRMDALGNDIVKRVLATRTVEDKVTLLGLSDPKVMDGFITFILATLALALVVTLIQKFVAPRFLDKSISWLSFKYSAFLLPVIAVVVGSIGAYLLLSDSPIRKMLPDTLEQRIDNINFEQHSVLERTTFYKDSFKLIKDYPILGVGGGGWAALYEKYQNNPYTSRQTHNFFLQFWIEVGTLGIIILAAFLLYIFYQYVRSYIKGDEASRKDKFVFYIIALSLLIHSTIDFEMSYGFIAALVYLCLGGMASGISSNQLSIAKHPWAAKVKLGYPILLGIIAITAFIMSAIQFSGNNKYALSLKNAAAQKPLQEIMNPLNKALELQPHHPDYVATKVGFLTQLYSQNKDEAMFNEAIQLLQETKRHITNNKILFGQELDLYSMKNDQTKMLSLVQEGLQQFPWDNALYERSATLNLMFYDQLRATNKAQAESYSNKVIETYNTALQKVKHLETLPKGQMQGAAFNLTPNIISSAAQIYIAHGDNQAAETILKSSIGGSLDDANTQLLVRLYLVSIMKQGRSDQDLYNKLIAKNANERAQIDNMLKTAP
ncbi:O-antigen ligase family protein [Paenibacillus ginsengarvi]|uniref:O-antigen ligase domain-containing protein n=1 Tax=Paenibacillus ginsengarvi TaxID=400777 RepID=A0A3B0CC54_9BACL|nr:O-antigen ligase family protein [Paenibacillus ginsengarvi]RKN82191.1 O-antigen ligase domain-containing protein [Paenibacillus ginsengarvi]